MARDDLLMGYPMTLRRVIHRNGLADGDYNNAPERHRTQLPATFNEWPRREGLPDGELARAVAPTLLKRVHANEEAMRLLAGDLRRLERDLVDENTICKHISGRTGIDPDQVAAVLKELAAL